MGRASRAKRQRRLNAGVPPKSAKQEPRAPETMGAEKHAVGKISESLGELIRPYADDDIDLPTYKQLATFGALAWNLSVDPDFISDDKLRELAAERSSAAVQTLVDLVHALSARKGSLFPDDRRFILHTEVRQQADGTFYLIAGAASGLSMIDRGVR